MVDSVGMAAFEPGSELTHYLDWNLVQDGFVTLFGDRDRLQEALDWLTNHGYHVVFLDAASWADPDRLDDDIAAGLDFPDYYGRNLNALEDCLSDVAEGRYGVRPDATGLVLVLVNYDQFAAADPVQAHDFLDIYARQARHAALIGHRMTCLIQSNDPDLGLAPVGAQRVRWNSRERPT